MRVQYSTPPPLNPVSQPFISRFYAHVLEVYEPPGDAPANGYDDLKRPAYTASGRRFFSTRLSNPLLVRVRTPSVSRSSVNLQRPSVTHGSAA